MNTRGLSRGKNRSTVGVATSNNGGKKSGSKRAMHIVNNKSSKINVNNKSSNINGGSCGNNSGSSSNGSSGSGRNNSNNSSSNTSNSTSNRKHNKIKANSSSSNSNAIVNNRRRSCPRKVVPMLVKSTPHRMTEAKTNPTMKDRVAFDSDSSVSTKENHIKHYDNSNIANRNSTDRKKDGSNDNNDGNCNDRNKDNPNHGEGNDNSNDVNNISSNSDIEEVREIVKIVAAPYPPPSSRLSFFKKRKDNEEEKRLDQFLIRYSTVYSFAADCFHKLVRELLQNRLLNPEWNEKATREHKLRVLRAVRVLTRDSRLQHILTASMPALTYLATELEKLKNDYYSDADYPYISECLVEFTSILKRLTAVDALRPKLFELSIHKTLVTLLSARDVNVLQAALIAMINLAQEPLLVQEGQGGDATEALNVSSSLLEATLHLFQQGQSHASCQFLAAELLDILVEYKSCRREIQLLSGNSIFLSFLHASTEENLLLVVLRCLANMAIDPNASREIRHLGGIPLILSLIRSGPNGSFPSASVCVSVCIALTQLSLDDENAFQIRKNKGVYIVGQLFLSGSQAPASDPTARELQVYALRMLRFIYSVERNRKVFKRLFPPLFYSSFIDVGHYDHNLAPYTALAEDFNRLPWAQKASAIAAFESLRSVSEGKRTLRGYIIQEVLGKGAFGTVYQVQKENSDSLYAMKELPLKEGQVPDHDMQRYVSALCEEVEIISKLEHPNIVKYYTSFVEGGHMYIIMELVQGTSLTDYISSVRGKQQRMSEEQIWSIFIQLTLALSYMHMERGVVHRDLTPSNVMVDQNGKVKITDFGLARQKNKESLMKSAVGTISFSCPEIILHKPYTEKADLWSLGCVLYQMAMLRPAFQGNNPLTVAQKIVEGQHEPLSSDLYSPLLTKVVTQLLAVKPEQRPNIIQVSALVSPLLMAELDRVNIINNRLTTQLKHEQELRRRDLDDFSRKQQAWRHILGSYGVSRAFMIDSAGAGGHTAPAHGSSSSSLLGDADKSTDATGMKAGMEQGKGGHINPNPAHSRPLRLPLQDMKDNRDRPLNVNTQIPSSAATPRASSSFSSLSSLPSSVGSYKGSNRHTRSRRGNTGRSTDKNKPGHSNAHSGSNSNNDVQSVHSNGDSPRSGSTATSALRSSSKSKRKSTASAGGAMAGDGLMSGGLGVVGVGLSNVSSSGGSKDTSPRNHQYQRQHSSNKAHASHDTTIQSTQGSSNSNDMDDSKHPSSASSSAASSSQSTQQQQQQQLQSVQVNNFPRYYSRQRQQFHSHTHSHRHHPGASKPIVHILSDKLRIIQDPIAAILTQLHKIVYLSQQPPTLEKDARRSYLIKYKRALFASSPTQSALKVEMQRLLSGSKDLVDLTFGVSGGEGGVNGGRGASRHSSNPTHALSLLTHEDLQVMIEKLLDETDYYCSSVQSSLSSSSLSSSSSSSSSAAIVTSSSALRTSTASVVGIYDPSSLLTLADPTSSSSSNSSTDIKHFDTNDKHVLHSNSIAYLDAERKHGREEGERDDKNNGDGKGSDFGSLSQVKDPFLIRNLFESPTNSGDNLNFPSFPKRSSSSDSSNNHVNTLDIDSSGENFDEVMSNVLPNVYRHGSMSSNTSSASMTAHLSSGKLRNKHANRSAHVNRGESVNLECLVQQGLSDEEIVNNFLQIGRVDSSTQQSDSKTSCADVGVEGDSLGIGDDSLDSDSAIFDNRHYIPSSSPTSPVQTPNKYSSKRKCDIDNDGKTCPPRNHSGNDGRIQLTPAHISSRLRLLNIDNEREFSSPARALNNIFQREKGDSDDSYADIGTSIDSSCGANRLGSNISSNPNSGTKSDGLIFQAI